MVEEVRARELAGVKVFGEPSRWTDVRQFLRTWREEGTRNSLKALEGGEMLLSKRKNELGNEVWSMYEQTFMAALDCGHLQSALKYLEKLQSRFAGSLRVQRLEGLYLEAQEKYEEALVLYDGIMEEHPTCSAVWKRKISVLRAQNNVQDAVAELNKMLHVFMTDLEAWLQLMDLYIDINEYRRAAFCVEELLLVNPHHYLYHLKMAEICYTLGSTDKMELARRHYATAIKLNSSCVRALFGFYMVMQWLSGKGKQTETRSKTSCYQSLEWVKVQIKKNYQFDDSKLRIVEKMLDRN